MDEPKFTPEFMYAMLKKNLELQNEYFEIQARMQENSRLHRAVTLKLPRMKLADQLSYLRLLNRQIDVCEELARKYDVEVPDDG